MKLPLSWLAEWVAIPWDAHELARRLTMTGLEVEGISTAAPAFSGVVVAQIVQIEPHPQADKLRICQVSSGTGALQQIVCGAANARVGLVTALATPGAVLPEGVKIKAAKLRGVESAGMLCSAREIGLAEHAPGIIELPGDLPLGVDLRRALDLDDAILEINVTPNRGDAMSVLGIAREIAVLSGGVLRKEPPPLASAVPQGASVSPVQESSGHGDAAVPGIQVTLQPGAGAARLCARVLSGLDNHRASPLWLVERLRRAGLRSISPVVDATNYVLLELGQPMHAYDRSRLQGALVARRAVAGERIELLDGEERRLTGDELVIADDLGGIGLAGVMGGKRTSIDADSTTVVLESAWFNPDAIAGRGRRFGLTTDAGQRFERGVDPAGQERAIERATQLILGMTGGAAGAITCAQLPDELPRCDDVYLRARQLHRLLGTTVAATDVESRLRALGLGPVVQADGWRVTVPSWRFDIHIEADLIEEVVRVGGLDLIPEEDAPAPLVLRTPTDAFVDEQRVVQTLTARGYWEAITFGFVDPQLQTLLLGEQPVAALANPIASDLAVLRTSLWPGLIAAARENVRRQHEQVRLFEIANRFMVSDATGRVIERKMLAGLVLGSRWSEQWGADAVAADFFDVRNDLQAVLGLAGPGSQFAFEPLAASTTLHPGRSARVLREGVEVGTLGELHPRLVRALDFTYVPILFEIDYALALRGILAQFREISRFPQIRRDISLTVREDLAFGAIRDRVSVAAASLLKELRIFDVYQGKGVETGRKSIALGLILQDLSRTLTDEEADRLIGAVMADLQTNLGARIRE